MKMPKGWGKKPVQIKASKKVTARIDMSPEIAGAGLCPACKQPMVRMIANDVPVYCCMEDRIVLPIKTGE